ncbi:MAG: dual specificity protein phosphatase family protein [Kofleriaceae bacterium]
MVHHAFLVLALVLGYVAATIPYAWIFWWPVAVLVAAWFVYLASAPGAFMKQPDGRLPWYAWVVWAPIFVWQWLAHEFVRAFSKEPVANEVAPGVWVGRRPRTSELRPDIKIVIDLCAELPAARGVTDHRSYVSIPTLDARSPSPEQIASAVDRVVATEGPALIHCAFGHGRSATVAAAVLVRRGDATLETVEATMKVSRPRIGINRIQRAALRAAAKLR